MKRIEYDPPKSGGVRCRHCSGEIVAVARILHVVEIAGLADYDWRHANGERGCPPIVTTAEPYDAWYASRLMERAGAEPWNEEQG